MNYNEAIKRNLDYVNAVKEIEKRGDLITEILGHRDNHRIYDSKLFYRMDLILLTNEELATILDKMNGKDFTTNK